MKTFFTAYGWRDTKSWSCPHCLNFWSCGMDLSVDESREAHLKICPALHEDPDIKRGREHFAYRCETLIERLNEIKKAAETGNFSALQELLGNPLDTFETALLYSYMPAKLVEFLKLNSILESGRKRLAGLP